MVKLSWEEAIIAIREEWRSIFCTEHACNHYCVCRGNDLATAAQCLGEHQEDYPEEFEEVIKGERK